MAGPTPPSGSSLGLEAAEFLKDAELRKSVVQLPSISESEKRWLFENSTLMLYPTVVEGFGLVPFEAANYGLATLSTRQGSLNEVLPKDIPTISSFDPAELAQQILDLLEDEHQRQMIVDRMKKTSEQFSAESTTDLLVEMFLDMTSRPPKRISAIIGEDSSVLSSEGGQASLYSDLTRASEPGFIVKLGWRLVRLKRLISPNGSRRQNAVRTVSNKVRRFLGR